MKRNLCLLLAFVVWPHLIARASDDEMPDETIRPFDSGEGLSYEIRLLGVLAAKADLELSGAVGKQLRIQANARSVGATESIFQMRSQASCTLEDDLEPSLCRSTSESRGKVKRREVRFDKESGVIQERKLEAGKVDQKKIELEPGLDGMQDALSGLYHLRAHLPPAGGDAIRFRSLVKGKPVTVEARTSAIERVETSLGTFEAAVVDVRILEKQDADAATHCKLWISLDERRLPLKAVTKAPLGTMEATLVDAKGVRGGRLARR